MKIELEYLEKVMKLLNENDLSEVTLEDGDKLIVLKKEQGIVSVAQAVPAISAPIAQSMSQAAQEAANKPDTRKTITSPMVGTFYKSPAPDAKQFVDLGDTVAPGQVVCIIEAMKLMNEIESEVSGRIVEICVQDGQPIEFGQVLMYVE